MTARDSDSDWKVSERLERLSLPEPNVRPLTADDPRMHVVIGIPMERTISQEAFFGFLQIIQQGWQVARLPYTRNDIARHKFLRHLRDNKDVTHLLMLDSDHVHPVDIVQRLSRWFLAYPSQIEVVGGLNFRRGEPYDPCAFVDPGDGHFHRLAEWRQPGQQPGALQVEVVGTGSMMIARSVLDRLPEEKGWFDYQYTDRDGWPGTDMTWCARCREAGIGLWVDITTVSPHIGTQLIDERTYREWLRVKMAEQAQHEIMGEVTLR